MTAHELEKIIIQEALDLKKEEAFSICILDEQILSKKSFPEMLATILAQQLGGDLVSKVDLEKLFLNQFNLFPSIIDDAICDLLATKDRDPACSFYLEPLLFFKGYQGIQAFRTAHSLWNTNKIFSAKVLQSIVNQKFSMDIHPAAKIG